MDPAKQNASGEGGAYTTKLAGCVSGQGLFDFNADHISSACRALGRNDCGPWSTHPQTQLSTPLKVVAYAKTFALNAFEGSTVGYAKLAMGTLDLDEGEWLFASLLESQIGHDGQAGVERYLLLDHRAGMASLQGERYLEEPS